MTDLPPYTFIWPIRLFGTQEYANAQSLNNKMEECREVVTVLKPKVIGITESCSEGKSEGDINLEGFIPYRDDHGRGSFSILRMGYSQHHVLNKIPRILSRPYGVSSH